MPNVIWVYGNERIKKKGGGRVEKRDDLGEIEWVFRKDTANPRTDDEKCKCGEIY